MKFFSIIKTTGLVLLSLESNVMAAPADGSIAVHDATIAAYRPDAIQSVLTIASELFAVQVVGAATKHQELEFLCQNFIRNSASRLAPLGYKLDLIGKIFCADVAGDKLPPLGLIQALSRELSTEIWIVQAIGAVTGRDGVQKLCELINVEAADAIGLQGDLVKKNVCAAAAVANQVSKSSKPASVTLKAPLVVPIAPVSELVLPFVPVQHR